MIKFLSAGLLVFALFVTGCTVDTPWVKSTPGLPKCVDAKVEKGNVMAGPVTIQGEGVSWNSYTDAECVHIKNKVSDIPEGTVHPEVTK